MSIMMLCSPSSGPAPAACGRPSANTIKGTKRAARNTKFHAQYSDHLPVPPLLFSTRIILPIDGFVETMLLPSDRKYIWSFNNRLEKRQHLACTMIVVRTAV